MKKKAHGRQARLRHARREEILQAGRQWSSQAADEGEPGDPGEPGSGRDKARQGRQKPEGDLR